jgi:hypothetical protein
MRFYVLYIHNAPSGRYWVSVGFATREKAQEYIDNNALVCRLPGGHIHEGLTRDCEICDPKGF